MSERIDETCSCGATFHFEGSVARLDASQWRREHRHEPQDALSGSNRRSVALGDAEVLEGAQSGAQASETRCPECIDLSPGVHYPNCKADESEGDRG